MPSAHVIPGRQANRGPHRAPGRSRRTAAPASSATPASLSMPTCGVFLILATATAAITGVPGMAAATDLPPALVGEFTRQVQPLLLNKCAAGACHGGAAAPVPRLIRAGVAGQFDRATTLTNMAALDEAIRRSGSNRGFLATISGRHPAEPGSSRLSLAPLTPPERAMLERWLVASAERRGPPRLLPQAGPDTLAIEKDEKEKPQTPEPRPADRGAPPRDPASGVKPVAGTEAGEPDTKSPPKSPQRLPEHSPAKPGPSPAASKAVTASPRRADAAPQRPNRFRALIDSAANPLPLPPPETPRGVLLGPAQE